jgi:hypothetical protein
LGGQHAGIPREGGGMELKKIGGEEEGQGWLSLLSGWKYCTVV